MNRGASATIQTEWAKAAQQVAHLCEMRFGDGTVYMTDWYRDVAWNGNTYTASSSYLGFGGLTESAELRITDVAVKLSGVDQTMISKFGTVANWIDRRFLVYKAWFNASTDVLLVSPIAIHDGRMDDAKVDEDGAGGSSIVGFSSHDQFADFERLAGRHTNDADQKFWFPTDDAFKLVSQLAGKQVSLLWGAARP